MAKSAKPEKEKKEKKEKGDKKSKADKKDKKADKGEATAPDAAPPVSSFPAPQLQIPCEGCSTSLSLVYCRSCDRTLCATCNQNSHLVKADANHGRVSVDDLQRYRVYCPEHKEERLLLFCQTCKIPICERCRIGSHQSIGHMIVTLESAYQAKLAILHSLISGKLGETRDSFITAMGNIERECSRAQIVVDNIEQETRQHMQAIIDNLHVEANRKFAFLRADQSQIVAALENMEKFSRSVMEDRKTPREFLTFMQNFESQMTLGMSLAHQRTPELKQLNLSDLPREIQARNSILERYAKLDDLISVKDAMIWYLIRERNRDSQELQNWSTMHEQYLKALEQYKMACKHCQITLSPGSINSTCLAPGHHKHYFERTLS